MLFAPAGTPQPVLDTIYATLGRVLKDPDTVSKLSLQGADIVGGTSAQLAEHVHSELARWSGIVKQAQIKSD
jgi:tripartite-type tricarboxylate transporter receptor subunit TctC